MNNKIDRGWGTWQVGERARADIAKKKEQEKIESEIINLSWTVMQGLHQDLEKRGSNVVNRRKKTSVDCQVIQRSVGWTKIEKKI